MPRPPGSKNKTDKNTVEFHLAELKRLGFSSDKNDSALTNKVEKPASKVAITKLVVKRQQLTQSDTYVCGVCGYKITKSDSMCPNCEEPLAWDGI